MGGYAKFNGGSVKIGTCEDMLYLRADQAARVVPMYGNVDPVRDRAGIRFRFPWPDEDHVDPGAFENPFRAVGLPCDPPAGIDHQLVQFTAAAGYVVSLPCPESAEGESAPYRVHRNGFAGAVRIVQQRWWEGRLVLVLDCGGCGSRFRLPTLADAEPYIVACRTQADRRAHDNDAASADWWNAVADRIVAGYREGEEPPEPEAGPPAPPDRLSRRDETTAVRRALATAGIKARVTHGRGTAWGWLDVRYAGSADSRRVVEIAQAVTGRRGEYDGRINVQRMAP